MASPGPDEIRIGASGVFRSVRSLAETIGGSTEDAFRMLEWFEVPTFDVRSGGQSYFSLYALEVAMMSVGLPKAMKETPELFRTNMELAGVLYGTLRREIIRERVKKMFSALTNNKRTGRPPKHERILDDSNQLH
jgi:hypothetical protein